MSREKETRNRELVAKKEAGATLGELSEIYGITQMQVWRLYEKYRFKYRSATFEAEKPQ